jgi:hypothetical protein
MHCHKIAACFLSCSSAFSEMSGSRIRRGNIRIMDDN